MDILNLSDLHFRSGDDPEEHFGLLVDDLRIDLKLTCLDALIVSGDITNFATAEEFALAADFLQRLMREFRISPGDVILCPGNHDANWSAAKAHFKRVERKTVASIVSAEHIFDPGKGRHVQFCDPDRYRERFQNFAKFHEDITGSEYSLDYDQQFTVRVFDHAKVIVVGLNSAWCLDHLRPGSPGIRSKVVTRVCDAISKIPNAGEMHKIAVWHHPLSSPGDDRIRDLSFAERLTKFGFRIGVHGHVHEPGNQWLRYEVAPAGRNMEILAAGTFGAPVKELPTGIPWGYNLFRIDAASLSVECRSRTGPTSPWQANAVWREAGTETSSKYTIPLRVSPKRPAQLYSRAQLLKYLTDEGIDAVGYRLAVEANIFDAEGRLLLQCRGPGARDERGKLEGVGGDLGRADDLHECLREKVAKEIGTDVSINIDTLFEVRPVIFEEDHGPQDWIVISYLCRLRGGVPRIMNKRLTQDIGFYKMSDIMSWSENRFSRSTARFLTLYKARFGTRPYFDILE